MASERADRIAREAARLIALGQAQGVAEAIRAAAETLGISGPLPGHGRVRKHAQAMSMQALGDAGYAASVRGVLAIAEELMTLLDESGAHAQTLLVGRAARGQIDAGVELHLRVYTTHSITDLARDVVEFGYDEPEFHTVESRFGRLSRLRFLEQGVPIVVTRLLPHMVEAEHRDLVTDRVVDVMTLDQLRARLGSG